MKRVCTQVNWQRQFGGGEMYTRFFTKSLLALGWEVNLVVDRRAGFWRHLGMDGVNFIPIGHGREIPAVLPPTPHAIVTHTTLDPDIARAVAARHRLGGFLHMPLVDRAPRGIVHYHRLFAVSAYVRDTARHRGYLQVIDDPMLGVADLAPRAAGNAVIRRRSEYDWDYRKFRDRVLAWGDPLRRLWPGPEFVPQSGLTLGLVSRLTPIKQFPQLFSMLTPVIAGIPGINLEIFGSGGYASVRDLRRALQPLGGRARFWGHQSNPAAVFPQLDFLLSGLPEREALGLNLIEAQTCGTPVLAIDAPPFTETVIDGESGYLYPDPRQDGGAGVRALLERLTSGELVRPDPSLATAHLAKFSEAAFNARVARAMALLAD